MVFESEELRTHWTALDEFEGNEYSRLLTSVRMGDETKLANIYALP